jgi:hypothetical protein
MRMMLERDARPIVAFDSRAAGERPVLGTTGKERPWR